MGYYGKAIKACQVVVALLNLMRIQCRLRFSTITLKDQQYKTMNCHSAISITENTIFTAIKYISQGTQSSCSLHLLLPGLQQKDNSHICAVKISMYNAFKENNIQVMVP